MSKSTGFTLVETLVAIVIGLFVTAGVSVFLLASLRTSDATHQHAQLLENGRVAMQLLTRDLRMSGFFGAYTGNAMVRNGGVDLKVNDIALGKDCVVDWIGTTPEGSFPSSEGRFSPLYIGAYSPANSLVGQYECISRSNMLFNSDIIGIKRVIGRPMEKLADLSDNRFYWAANTSSAQLLTNKDPWPTSSMPNAEVWEYQHHVYYVGSSAQSGLPTLYQLYLHYDDASDSGDMRLVGSAPLVEGVERMRLLVGVDTDVIADGIVDDFIRPDEVTPQQWIEKRVLGVKLFVLVRSLTEDPSYTNTQTYVLGDLSFYKADHYRRMLFQTTVSLRNLHYEAGS